MKFALPVGLIRHLDRLFGGPRMTFEHCVINSLPAKRGSDTRTLSRRSTATLLIYVLPGWADILPCQSTSFAVHYTRIVEVS